MKKNRFQFLMQALALIGLVSLITLSSCKKDDDDEPATAKPVASFQYAIDDVNFFMVTFTNFSQNATSYSWDFADGNTSTEKDPVHTYAEAGTYVVELTASNDEGESATFTESIEIKDPDEALTILAGETSKTWKLYREGTSLGVGPDPDQPRIWWSLGNTGERPCVYYQEFTFHRDGTYEFDDKGSFWGEGGVFQEDLVGTCFEAVASNMVGAEGADLSSWLGGTHQFEYVSSNNTVTLMGEGAWIGLVKLGTTGEVTTPQSSVSFQINIEQFEGYDLMHVMFTYDGVFWDATYASYSDPSLEPDVVEEAPPWGEDLPNLTPEELYHTFESETSFAHLGDIGGTSVITVGQDDPAGGDANVGMFERVAGEQWQEAQLRTVPELYDIQFDSFSTVSIDIYIPEGTEFTEGGLQRFFVFGFADMSQTQEWWNSPVQFVTEGDDVVVGAWHTYTFDLTDVKEREDIDMIYLGIGGGGHDAGGIFYVRNFIFD